MNSVKRNSEFYDLTLVCDHAGKPDTIVATLWRDGQGEWTATTVDAQNPRTRVFGDYSIDQLMDGVRARPGAELSTSSRARWQFNCHRCKRRVAVRGDKLAAYTLERGGRIKITSWTVNGRPRLVAVPPGDAAPAPRQVTGLDGKTYRLPRSPGSTEAF